MLPAEFYALNANSPGFDRQAFDEALNQPAPVTIRLNPHKFSEALPAGDGVRWNPHGRYLEQRPVFAHDPLWHAGAYYVQEAASQFLWQLLHILPLPEHPVVCDLCAAPGGKSTLLSTFLNDSGLLIANEVIRPRAAILHENLTRWGIPNFGITSADPAQLAGQPWCHLCVVDAPCSGEGLFRRDPASIAEWSPQQVELCAARQKRILQHAWNMLLPGGILIYSTCTYNQQENEDNLAWLNSETELLPLSAVNTTGTGIVTGQVGEHTTYRFWPHRTASEGLFFCAVQKPHHPTPTLERATRPKKKPSVAKPPDIPWQDDLHLQAIGDDWYGMHPKSRELLDTIFDALPSPRAGIALATPKGRQLQPHPHAAFVSHANFSSLPAAELNLNQALHFLARLDPGPPTSHNGLHAMTFAGIPLGFANRTNGRWNNLYPQNWRLRNLPPNLR